jgi:hypothetical protein
VRWGYRRYGLQVQGGLVVGMGDRGRHAVALGLGDVGWGVAVGGLYLLLGVDVALRQQWS